MLLYVIVHFWFFVTDFFRRSQCEDTNCCNFSSQFTKCCIFHHNWLIAAFFITIWPVAPLFHHNWPVIVALFRHNWPVISALFITIDQLMHFSSQLTKRWTFSSQLTSYCFTFFTIDQLLHFSSQLTSYCCTFFTIDQLLLHFFITIYQTDFSDFELLP